MAILDPSRLAVPDSASMGYSATIPLINAVQKAKIETGPTGIGSLRRIDYVLGIGEAKVDFVKSGFQRALRSGTAPMQVRRRREW